MDDRQEQTVQPVDTGGLIARSAEGDFDAFRKLLEAHRDYSFRLAYGLLQDRDEADDAVQEAFIRVWHALGKFRQGEKFTTWLHRIVVNVSYDRIRTRSRRNRLFGYVDRIFESGDPPGGEDPSAGLEAADVREAVTRLARRLPPKQYLVFHLRDLLDLSVEETAATAGLSVNTVKVNLCLARKKMRAGLERMRGKHE